MGEIAGTLISHEIRKPKALGTVTNRYTLCSCSSFSLKSIILQFLAFLSPSFSQSAYPSRYLTPISNRLQWCLLTTSTLKYNFFFLCQAKNREVTQSPAPLSYSYNSHFKNPCSNVFFFFKSCWDRRKILSNSTHIAQSNILWYGWHFSKWSLVCILIFQFWRVETTLYPCTPNLLLHISFHMLQNCSTS